MSYGHCIVLPNQNRDTVQIISVQDKAVVKEYKHPPTPVYPMQIIVIQDLLFPWQIALHFASL